MNQVEGSGTVDGTKDIARALAKGKLIEAKPTAPEGQDAAQGD